MSETLNVDSEELSNTGSNVTDISANVHKTYNEFKDIVEQVTSNESWKGAASAAFLEKFESIRPTFEQDLQQLEDLGPTLISIANEYSEAEERNVAAVKEGDIC